MIETARLILRTPRPWAAPARARPQKETRVNHVRLFAAVFAVTMAAASAGADSIVCAISRSSFPAGTVTGFALDEADLSMQLVTRGGLRDVISAGAVTSPGAPVVFRRTDCAIYRYGGDRRELQIAVSCRDAGQNWLQLQMSLGPDRRGGRLYSLLTSPTRAGRQDSLALENCHLK